MTRTSEPLFNVPGVVLAILAICALVWAGQTYLLSDADSTAFVYCFGFVPARYNGTPLPAMLCPLGTGAEIWTFLTHAFLHDSITHLAINSITFLPFGSVVARRFGAARMLGFFIATVTAGALMHLASHWGEEVPGIGASSAVFGFMAGAIRFIFQPGGLVATYGKDDPSAYFVPASPLSSVLRDRRVVVLLVVLFGLNLAGGLFGVGMLEEQSVGWEAHIGGFVAGLLLFPLFDPVPAGGVRQP